MSANLLGKSVLAASLLLCVNLMLSCATVIEPVKPGAAAIPDADHGLVFGRIHLTRSGEGRHGNFRLPTDMRWWITEETEGRQYLIDRIPIDGPFAVALPTGSYHLTKVILNDALGTWQASLPATFSVRSRECTYLGTRNFHVQAGFFDGFITQQVLNEEPIAEVDLRRIIGDRSWPVMWAPFTSSTESAPIILTFQTQGTQLTSPP